MTEIDLNEAREVASRPPCPDFHGEAVDAIAALIKRVEKAEQNWALERAIRDDVTRQRDEARDEADATQALMDRCDEAAERAYAWVLELRAEHDALAETVERVRRLHRPVGIYDECDCDDVTTDGHVNAAEVGLTCNRIYAVCRECCTDDGYQSEECATYHEHQPDEPHHCPTMKALDGTDNPDSEVKR